MTRIEGSTSFERPAEEVFDFLADPRNEEFQPRGPLRLVGPLVGLAGRRLEQRIWADMKRYVDTASHWTLTG
ncbi:MAG: hypothetical protein ICV70_03525 [Jiangellaceae bacterium]|nr:hypothetical protein [Jiangellaceae bacterium]